jgi:hypothetical protein
MQSTDMANAAGNLAESSYASGDRQKVKDATDANIKTLNEGRTADIADVGKLAETDKADYAAKKANLGYTRDMLGRVTDETTLENTVGTLTEAKNSIPGAKAKYQARGAFFDSANKLGNYDTKTLDATIQGVVDNASATQESKQSTIMDIIDGTGMTQDQKNTYKSKYLQKVV